jgi:hypothetical protein
LPALRNRATQLLGVSGLAASFLGGIAHPATGQPLGVWGWFAVAVFVVTAGLCLWLLWPRRFFRAPKSSALVSWAETPDVSRADMDRDLALYVGQKYAVNRKRMDRLSNFYSAAVVALLIEIAAFVIDLWSR